ncbi:formate dehydrogenase subunit gamma [Pseudomonas sp. Marseille-QA0892]
MKKMILRYNANERTNHWIVSILFVLAGLSGLALFHPALFWLSNLFGGGTWTRILHPFIGVGMFLMFLWLVIRFWRNNLFIKNDRLWLKNIGKVMKNEEEGVPPIGKYNPGQKLLFWSLIVSMLLLAVTGVVMWRAYFSHFFGIDLIRLASLVHAFAAFVLVTSIIVHIYAAIWIKGSFGAMMSGWVSRAWAKKHHELWYDEVVRKEQQKR